MYVAYNERAWAKHVAYCVLKNYKRPASLADDGDVIIKEERINNMQSWKCIISYAFLGGKKKTSN